MSGYALFDNLEVVDAESLEEYKRRVAPVVEAHGGKYVVLGGEVDVVEGSAPFTFPVLIEFPSVEAARRWYDSEAYRELKALRLRASRSNGVIFGASERNG